MGSFINEKGVGPRQLMKIVSLYLKFGVSITPIVLFKAKIKVFGNS